LPNICAYLQNAAAALVIFVSLPFHHHVASLLMGGCTIRCLATVTILPHDAYAYRADFAMSRCPSVRPFICHTVVLCQTAKHISGFFTLLFCQPRDSVF